MALASWGAVVQVPTWSVVQAVKQGKERAAERAARGPVRRTASSCSGCLSILIFGATFYVFALVLVAMCVLAVDVGRNFRSPGDPCMGK